jgi:hypothetical protein
LTTFVQPVVTSAINPADNLVGFQGDFTFNSSIVTFQNPPVSNAGLTAGNWNVSGNILPGSGSIRTLRISAFSNNFTPISGSGTLFQLNLTKISSTTGATTPLNWKPDPDNFFFIDAGLAIRTPGSTPAGSITFQAATVSISGAVIYCSNPSFDPVPNVTLSITGDTTNSTLSNGSGDYTLSSLPSGGSFTVTPTKTAIAPGTAGINTVDVVATQRHFLGVTPLPPGCALTAADVNGDSLITTTDVIAIQRFALGLATGIANAGQYQFTPATYTYPGIVSNQVTQNFDTLVFGDVTSGFVNRPASGNEITANEVPATVAAITLPEVAIDASAPNVSAQVTTTTINAGARLVGFQGDFTFDERVVTFEREPVRKAGVTGGNWNVSGNVLAGTGPIRTLRVSAFSNDFTPLSGSGALFELRMRTVSDSALRTPHSAFPLLWAAPPDEFIFIDADLKTQRPGNAVAWSVAAKKR